MLDASGSRHKTAPFGRKSAIGAKRTESFRGKSRALFFACVLFGAMLGLTLMLSDSRLVSKDDWQQVSAASVQKMQEFRVRTGKFGLDGLYVAAAANEKLLQEIATVKQHVIMAYTPLIKDSARTVHDVTQKINGLEQAAVEQVVKFASAQKSFLSLSPRKKYTAPASTPNPTPLEKVLDDIDSFAQIAPAAGDSPAEAALADKLPPLSDEISEKHEVQSVLIARRQAVISSVMSGRILELPFQNGDVFEADDILAKFDCAIENALYSEKSAALRLAKAELKAKKQLRKLGTLSEIEYIAAQESAAQEQARLEQVAERISLCTIKAPFDGRVTNRLASPYEYAERGRVLMEISAREPLLLQFLVPSVWLRWLNIGTPFDVYVEESGKTYQAKVIRVHGKIDPVSQTAEIVAEMSSYQEELLPGMGGKAIFDVGAARKKIPLGFIGLKVAAMPGNAPQDSGDE